MNNFEQAAVKAGKKIWLDGTEAVKAELEKLIIGERGFVRNNAWTLLAINAALFLGIGFIAGRFL